jgi:hypothetical protein
MVWQRGKRRHEMDAARFVAALCRMTIGRGLGPCPDNAQRVNRGRRK